MDKVQVDYLKTLRFFAMVSFLEGMSFVVLLFIAMPVKYLGGIEVLVKYIGAAHGLFFIVYVFVLAYLFFHYKWAFKRSLLYFLASIIPFAPFWVHKQLAKEISNHMNQ